MMGKAHATAVAASSLLFSIEQWELIRRLRNSGLTKEDICQAFDELDRVERELGPIYDTPVGKKPAQQTNELFAKNFQLLLSQAATNGVTVKSNKSSPTEMTHMPSEMVASTATSAQNSAALTQTANNLVNAYFANLIDTESENKQIEEFRSKGEVVIHSEISFFVYKHDLKQSQIARMAGVNQAYVSKFLRGEFFDLSENGKTLIYRWYLRFLKHPAIYLKAHNITFTSNEHLVKAVRLESAENSGAANLPTTSFNNVTNTAYDQPKRTRFSFKTEHLVILEKAFLENQYPDQKKREDIAKSCNEARPCSERERVTEQIITHWFQNKRKISRKANCEDQTSPRDTVSLNGGGLNHGMHNGSSSSALNNDEEGPPCDELSNQVEYQNSCSPLTYHDFMDEQPGAPQPPHLSVKSNDSENNDDDENDEIDHEDGIGFET